MKNPRTIAIADHLWELLGRMAEEMGCDREALVNQALHGLARLHGYLPAGAVPAAEPAERQAAAQKVLETAARLEQAIAHAERDTEPPRLPPGLDPAAGVARPALTLLRDDGREVAVEKDRFVIGRGRGCDLVLASGKISREHAAVVRDGDGWALEDLGSANGTWHARARIDRRRIEDGDEFFICAERLRCRLRPA